MSNRAPVPHDATSLAAEEAPHPSILRAERRLGLLAELTEIGMEMARALGARARLEEGHIAAAAAAGEVTIEDPDSPPAAKGREPAELFAPLSRAIRMTIALEAKTDRELRDLKAGVVRERQEKVANARLARIERVNDLVTDAYWAESEGEEECDWANVDEALDILLERDEASLGCPERPLRETVETACRALGLDPDWSQWDGECWIKKEEPLRRSLRPNALKAQTAANAVAPCPAPQTPVPNGHDLQ